MSEIKLIHAVHFIVDGEIYEIGMSHLDGYAYLNKGDETVLHLGGRNFKQVSVDYKIFSPFTDTGSHWSIIFVASEVTAVDSKLAELLKK
ncbi:MULTISPECIES: hypothetical protein [Pseudomonas]|uniref:hypothetical protein n=1 Tax=Pseudomonas TaxID=286 RepID=UPI000C29707A|nr:MULTISPECIES: hypothetical protein [Pseudomonas]MBS7598227.1 hypothetical protein [Pseudomonas sp. RC2C2]MCP6699071.1 hypothetical protein [Pseudomonas donghuensis]PJY97970.1 hypothetical protein COO64_00055 [Pseudomonas donghuensis]UVL29146.1 hypothetical protein LOY32_23805 [Pseudomonas donghuensis]WKY28027.1 hypothetical protein QYF67_24770 [Pseudomonas donghuensis]